LIAIAHLAKGDFVVIPAASSSVRIAATEIAKAEGAVSIATTRKSNKKAELLSLGADHIIATEEEDIVARAREITGGKGARMIFDPVAGPLLEKLAEAAAEGGIVFEYGWLSMQPTPFPLFKALSKGLSIRGHSLMEITRNPEKAASSEEVYLRPVGGWTVPSEGRADISVRADGGGLQISRIKCTGAESRGYCSLIHADP
jgi:NADPH:quinone reductase-like Zn-dependent oxidoreductase